MFWGNVFEIIFFHKRNYVSLIGRIKLKPKILTYLHTYELNCYYVIQYTLYNGCRAVETIKGKKIVSVFLSFARLYAELATCVFLFEINYP